MNEPAKSILVPDRLQEREARVVPMAPNANLTPQQMVSLAVSQNADPEKLKQLMDLQERWEANEARKAFVEAMAYFKAEPHVILKTKKVDIQGGAKFSHATLADVVDGVVASLAKFGLSHNWVTEQADRLIKVTCVITHRMGHSERTEMVGAPDDSGKKNAIQQIGSTVTYLQRYTLLALCGLAAKDMDDDAKKAGQQQKAAEPMGYDNWALDMEATADEGIAKLQEVWKKSSDEFRRYTVKHEDDWWAKLKTKAAKVPS